MRVTCDESLAIVRRMRGLRDIRLRSGVQVQALIMEVQRLQGVERERDAYRRLAEQRAGLALGVMDQVRASS